MANEPMIKISLRKDIQLEEIKDTILDMIEDIFKKASIEIVDNIEFTFDPPCGCPSFKMKLNKIPLEDLTCSCGKTILIKYERTNSF